MYSLVMTWKNHESFPAPTFHEEQNLEETISVPVVIWDEKHPRSLINLVEDRVKDAMQNALKKIPDYFELDEQDLYKKLYSEKLMPTPTDNRIRLRFWMEYDYAQTYNKRKLDMARVIAGICSFDYFYNHYLKSVSRVAWLISMPTGYGAKSEEALEFALEQMRDILAQNHLVNGKVDTKLGELKAKIYNMLDNRLRGAVVQKTMSLNVNTSSPQVAQRIAQSLGQPTAEALEKRLKELRAREKKNLNGGADGAEESAIEVQAADVTGSEPQD